MSDYWCQQVIDQVERGDSLEQIDREFELIHSVSVDERGALWLVAWGEQQRRKRVAHRRGTNAPRRAPAAPTQLSRGPDHASA
jgi:hypothetical protein